MHLQKHIRGRDFDYKFLIHNHTIFHPLGTIKSQETSLYIIFPKSGMTTKDNYFWTTLVQVQDMEYIPKII